MTVGDEDGSGDQQRRKTGDPSLRCTRENARRADLVRTNPELADEYLRYNYENGVLEVEKLGASVCSSSGR